MGIYELTGWLISIVFILIDTTAIIIKVFTPRSVYDALLEKNEKEQMKTVEEILEGEYELQRDEFNKDKEKPYNGNSRNPRSTNNRTSDVPSQSENGDDESKPYPEKIFLKNPINIITDTVLKVGQQIPIPTVRKFKGKQFIKYKIIRYGLLGTGLIFTPIALWIGYEGVVVSRIKLTRILFLVRLGRVKVDK
ncbi:MAG: hypothetical protein QNJ70_03710 [Xenococcaceae cyanobacterium MO_207.B15]|nr:hypothetical protein [Xenococcaceae cyanobacterium MO_207.B15]